MIFIYKSIKEGLNLHGREPHIHTITVDELTSRGTQSMYFMPGTYRRADSQLFPRIISQYKQSAIFRKCCTLPFGILHCHIDLIQHHFSKH